MLRVRLLSYVVIGLLTFLLVGCRLPDREQPAPQTETSSGSDGLPEHPPLPGGGEGPLQDVYFAIHAVDPTNTEYSQGVNIRVSITGINGEEGLYLDEDTGEYLPGPQMIRGLFTPFTHHATFGPDVERLTVTVISVMPAGSALICWVVVNGQELPGSRQPVPATIMPVGPVETTCRFPV